jgi:hypothetical protein
MIITLILYTISDAGNERGLKEKNYLGVALAEVKAVRDISKLNFSDTGNEFYITSRVVDYTFIVDGEIYSGQDIVPAKLRFKEINLRLKARKEVYIKYDINNPYNNIISRKQRGLH